MKKSIFALILIAIIGHIGMVWPAEISKTAESPLSQLPGVSIASFAIFGPEISARDAIQKLQLPRVTDENVNAKLKNVDEIFKLLFTRNFDRPTLVKAEQAVEGVKQEGDAIKKFPGVKDYFENLISIARKRLYEAHENKETREKLDIALGAAFALDPVITIFSVGVQEPLQWQKQIRKFRTGTASESAPITPPPLPPASAEPSTSTTMPPALTGVRPLTGGVRKLPEWLTNPGGIIRKGGPVTPPPLMPASSESSSTTGTLPPAIPGYKPLPGVIPIKPNIPN